jgi:Icc-related predicted phosphoesterase
VRLVITPGNDDPFVIDEVLAAAERVECPERALLELGPITLASLGNTNQTPWDTPREYSEGQLSEQIEDMLAGADPGAKLVFNFHCPPKGSGLDCAAKLDSTLKPVVVGGRVEEISAGSTAVREAIVRHRPVVGLHGHIHESAGAWRHNGTICVNPGSDYGSGVLKGALVLFNGDGSYGTHLLTTG